MIYEPRVIHLSAKIGEPELGMACALGNDGERCFKGARASDYEI